MGTSTKPFAKDVLVGESSSSELHRPPLQRIKMLLPKNKLLRDKKWLKNVRDNMTRVFIDTPYPDPAHIRHGLGGGMGLKPSDNLVIPLCHELHSLQHTMGEKTFWNVQMSHDQEFMMKCVKAYAREIYSEWKNDPKSNRN